MFMKSKLHHLLVFVGLLSISLVSSLRGQSGVIAAGITPMVTAVDTEGNSLSLKNGDTIQEGWVISTAPGSRIILKFPAGEVFSMDSSSEIAISKVDPTTLNLEKGRVTAMSVKGRVLNITTANGASSSTVEEEGIFSLSVDPSAKTTLVQSLQGSVDIKESSGNEFTLGPRKGTILESSPLRASNGDVPAVRDLTNPEITELASIVDTARLMVAGLQGGNFIPTVLVFNDPEQLLEVSESQ